MKNIILLLVMTLSFSAMANSSSDVQTDVDSIMSRLTKLLSTKKVKECSDVSGFIRAFTFPCEEAADVLREKMKPIAEDMAALAIDLRVRFNDGQNSLGGWENVECAQGINITDQMSTYVRHIEIYTKRAHTSDKDVILVAIERLSQLKELHKELKKLKTL